ncbi:MAG: ECF transporter S component [Clostridiaceae bacterium]
MSEIKKKSQLEVADIIQVGLFAAITFVATKLVQIPYNLGGIAPNGLVHLGDSIVFIAAILFGKKKAALASAIGMTLFDLTSPYAIWAPVTLIAKFGLGYICGAIAYRGTAKGDRLLNNILATVVSGAYMVLIYLIGGTIITVLTVASEDMTFMKAFIINVPGIIRDSIQIVAGAAVAIPISTTLARVLPKSGIKLNS